MTEPDAVEWGLLEPLGASAGAASDDAVLEALVDMERALVLAWDDLGADAAGLDAHPVAESLRADTLDRDALLTGAREGGVPVIALVEQLRAQAEAAAAGAGPLVHAGATSQDVLDSALVLVARRTLGEARARLVTAGESLAALAGAEASTRSIARTLGQHAEPSTMGAQAAGWLDGVSSAIEVVDRLRYPVQLGGAVGTGLAFDERMPHATARLRAAVATRLGLDDPERAWHAERTPVLAVADAAATVVAVVARIGRDVAFLTRTEIGELRIGRAGGSSAMPHKRNPVDAVLLVANGLRAPGLLATVHTAAVSQDARPSGEWHAEWQAVRGLLRLAIESADAAAALSPDIAVDHDAVRRTVALSPGLDRDPDLVLAASARLVEAAVTRFRAVEEAGR